MDISIAFPDRFHAAVDFVEKRYGDLEANTELDSAKKLALYAMRQQAEIGDCNTPQPSMWRITERYKHDAWSKLRNVSRFEAMVAYVVMLEELVGKQWIQSVVCEKNGQKDDEDMPSRENTPENIDKLVAEILKLRKELAIKEELLQRQSTVPEKKLIPSIPSGSESKIVTSADTKSMVGPLPVPPSCFLSSPGVPPQSAMLESPAPSVPLQPETALSIGSAIQTSEAASEPCTLAIVAENETESKSKEIEIKEEKNNENNGWMVWMGLW